MNKAKHEFTFNDVSGLGKFQPSTLAKDSDRECPLAMWRFLASDSLIPAALQLLLENVRMQLAGPQVIFPHILRWRIHRLDCIRIW
jgi:hypothetical protein